MNSLDSATTISVGYVPLSRDYESPGDSRRFIYYASQRNFSVEIADINKAYDFVVITQAADLSVWHQYNKAPVIFDFIDSYYSLPKANLKNLMRGFAKYASGKTKYLQLNYWTALEKMCRNSAAIICSTDQQKEILKQFNENIHVILDVHKFATFAPNLDLKKATPFRLLWEGLPQNINSLKILKNVLGESIENDRIELHVISDKNYYKYLGKYWIVDSAKEAKSIFQKVVFHQWSQNSLIELARNCDAAIIPIDLKNALASGKPENKLLLFWRMGLPVVTSNTQAYKKAMLLSGFDFTCLTDLDWIEKLQSLMDSSELRKQVSISGHRVTQDHYSVNSIIKKWDYLISTLNLGR